jgi:hypothetical protein
MPTERIGTSSEVSSEARVRRRRSHHRRSTPNKKNPKLKDLREEEKQRTNTRWEPEEEGGRELPPSLGKT